MQKIDVVIESEPIRLDHLLQIAGIAMSGGQAGQMIKQGIVRVNGQIALEKRKKIFLKDEIIFDDEHLIKLKA